MLYFDVIQTIYISTNSGGTRPSRQAGHCNEWSEVSHLTWHRHCPRTTYLADYMLFDRNEGSLRVVEEYSTMKIYKKRRNTS